VARRFTFSGSSAMGSFSQQVTTERRELAPRAPRRALPAALLMTAVFGAVDLWSGYEVSLLALYLLPPAIAGWHTGRRGAVAVALAGALAWLWADLGAGHPYSHPGIAYWNAFARLAIFSAFGALAAELRSARERAAGAADEDGLHGAGSFYRMLEREHGRLARGGRPLTLAYVDAGGVRGEGGAAVEAFGAAVLDALRRTLRGTDLIARPRGKEFAVLLADTGPEAAAVALERLRGALARLAERQGGGLAVTIGAVSCEVPARELNDVVQRAYQLMYQAERAPAQVTVVLEPLTESEAVAVAAA
jgi:diguanylate cyclase (GGDEF)-like protein